MKTLWDILTYVEPNETYFGGATGAIRFLLFSAIIGVITLVVWLI